MFQNYIFIDVNFIWLCLEVYVFICVWVDVVECLWIFGVEVEILEFNFKGEVEVFKIEMFIFVEVRFEGIVYNIVMILNYIREVIIFVGGFWVFICQVNVVFVISFLELEDVVLVVVYNIIFVDVGEEYLVYRVVKDDQWSVM